MKFAVPDVVRDASACTRRKRSSADLNMSQNGMEYLMSAEGFKVAYLV